MLFDVFISYSRKDIDEAEKLCQELEAAGVKYWIDRNIHGSANFLSEITKNIRQCKVVIFIASNNFANSEWTQKEILYALKRQKKIIPFRIGEFSFDTNDELDFVFSNVQWLESREQVVRDVCELCGIDYATQRQHHAEQKTEPEEGINENKTDDIFYSLFTKRRWRTSFKWVLVTMCLLLFIGGGAGIYEVSKTKHQQQIEEQIKADSIRVATERAETEKTYKVGDYYNDGTKEGVVFWVDATGKHGKIVSLAQKYLPWCTEAQYDKKIAVGATSKTDGKANTDKVMARADNVEYRAFVWCRNMGKSWYLPAIDELELLLLNDSVHDAVNKTLESRGATKLYHKGDLQWYWSSTEYAGEPEFCAWGVNVSDGVTDNGRKYLLSYVRAVSAF